MIAHPVRSLSLAAASLLLAAGLSAQDHAHGAGDYALGDVDFPTSCVAAAQPHMERGVAMLHSFWFPEARAAFQAAAEADPACAMAHWGVAMTLLGNPMVRRSPGPDALRAAWGSVERALALAPRASHREQLWIAAAEALFSEWEGADHLTRMGRYEEALRALHEAHPEDVEARIFYALAMVANAPPDDLTFAGQEAGAALLEPLFAERPRHPGLAHYIIHAYDAPPLAGRGLDAARRYADIAPSAPHALHMPSHIFTRLGLWEESVVTNARAAEAEGRSMGRYHPMDYMVYAYLQQGRDADALRVLREARALADDGYDGAAGAVAYNFLAMPARYAVERGAWAEAAGLAEPGEEAIPFAAAVVHFARAVGAARSGQVERAEAERERMEELLARLRADGDGYWSVVVDAQTRAAAAWVAHARGDTAAALRLAREAAELEETVEKHPVTPGPLLPARELEGELLLELNRPDQALRSFERSLEREPNRARSLFGAARAAEMAGRDEVARVHYRAYLDLMAEADATRQEPERARSYLGRGGAR